MAHKSAWTVLDYSGEKSTIEMYNGAITAASLPGYLTQFGNMKTAIQGITIGVIHKERWVGDDTLLSNTLPVNAFAQRELKWLVRYKGNTTNKIFTMEIPTADPSAAGRLVPGTDKADLTEAGMAAFKTAFEALGRSPDSDLETVTLLDIFLVGRNL